VGKKENNVLTERETEKTWHEKRKNLSSRLSKTEELKGKEEKAAI